MERVIHVAAPGVTLGGGGARFEPSTWHEPFARRVLWPLLHYQLDRMRLEAADWEGYVEANEEAAEELARRCLPGDRIWVHDLRLMLLPAALRRRLPDARIGYFLHAPFPSGEVFRVLPMAPELLRGLVGADLIGFHTDAYAKQFEACLASSFGIARELRRVRIGVFPMPIDAAAYAELADRPSTVRNASEMKRAREGVKLLLGVERLDYTSGLPFTMRAVEHLLEREPSRRGTFKLLHLAVPEVKGDEEYRAFQSDLHALAARINGAHGTIHGVPIHYCSREVPRSKLVELYRAADVMVVAPLRRGMSRVAKEFVASRTDGDGVLVLSELAGAAAELSESVLINPYDVAGLATSLAQALDLPEAERRRRMGALRGRVLARSLGDWSAAFVRTLDKGAAQWAC